jgi:dipeptidyl-peptidase 4
MKKFLIFGLVCSIVFESISQKKEITLEDVWQKNTFATKSIQQLNWMNNSDFYTILKDGNIVKTAVVDNSKSEIIYDGKINNLKIESFQFSTDENKILLETNFKARYRRSGSADYYVFDRLSNTQKPLSLNGKQSNVSFSPDGSKAAFTRNNNIYVVDLLTEKESQITTSGKSNEVINGSTDWVYEEEFGFAKAYFWSPDGSKIAYYTFDETMVPEYKMQMWGALYPTENVFKYPKAGEKNSVVTISTYNFTTNTSTLVDTGSEKNQYIPQIQWTNDSNILAIWQLNRLQNNFNLLHVDLPTNQTKTIINEKSTKYIDFQLNRKLIYLADGQSFITSSEQSGFKHLYQFDMQGNILKQLTNGQWDVDDLKGIDEANKKIYFTSTEVSPMERHLYNLQYEPITVISKSNKSKKTKIFDPIKLKLTDKKGTNKIDLSKDFKYYVESNSSFENPLQVTLKSIGTNETVKILEKNEQLIQKIEEYNIKPAKPFSFNLPNGTPLNGYLIKPIDFDENKKYPVLMFVYGGPGSQQVTDAYGSAYYYWNQMLANRGYIVACVDNRGTGGRGTAFRQITYGNLGKYEVEDQIEAAKYLGNLPYVDKSRIGIWGWSYGGFMAANCIFQGADVFKAAIAVAPVSNWRYYDSIYTERYNGLPQDNPAGYQDNSPIAHTKKLKGNFMLIHGTGDDNVHFQNAVDLQNALIADGKQFTSFYYPNRNHGITGGNTRLHLFTMMTDWLLKNL